jgi:hypothetical protein
MHGATSFGIAKKHNLDYELIRRRIYMARKRGFVKFIGRIGNKKIYRLSKDGMNRVFWYTTNGCNNDSCKLCKDKSYFNYNPQKKSLTLF